MTLPKVYLCTLSVHGCVFGTGFESSTFFGVESAFTVWRCGLKLEGAFPLEQSTTVHTVWVEGKYSEKGS